MKASWAVFFCCIRVIYFSSAYALPTFCLRRCSVRLRRALVSWSAYARLRLPLYFRFCLRRPAFGASVGSAFCLVFSCFAYAGLGRYGHLVPIKVVPNWRDDRPKGLKGGKGWQCLREAYATPTPSLRDERGTNVACLSVCPSACLFVGLPFLPFLPIPWYSMPSNSIPSISHLQHSLRR